MTALVISISSDVSVESVGSSFPRVILIGSISVEVSVTPEVGAASVASPVEVLELDTHSSSEANPSKISPPPVSVAPMVLPFLCSNDSKSDTEIPERHVSPTTSTPEIPTALPFYLHRLLLYTLHHFDRFTSGSSSSHSFSDHSSSGHPSSGHSLSRHTPPNTTDADSSTPQRFVYPPLARPLRCSESYLCWRSDPLSTMYPSTTSKSSAGDSSFESSARPSRKICRSPATTVTSSIHSTRALVHFHVDLLLPRKRFRDFISLKDCVEEDINTDALEDIKADDTVVEEEVEDEAESSDRGTIEVRVDIDAGIDIPDGRLMPDAIERLGQNLTITRSDMTPEAIEELVNLRVEEALSTYEEAHAANALEAENQSQNDSDGWKRISKKRTKSKPKPDKIRQEMKSVEKSTKSKSKLNQSKPGTNLEKARKTKAEG
nr:hypothetical protein [Tanacetum cinerariifolium]